MENNKINKKIANINRLLVKASSNTEIKQELLKQPKEAFIKHHIAIKAPKVTVVENKKNEYHLVLLPIKLHESYKLHKISKKPKFNDLVRYLTTLCLTDPKAKDLILKNCNSFLHHNGVDIPEDFNIHVHITTKDHAYFVIPYKGDENEHLSKFELDAIAGGNFWDSIGDAFSSAANTVGNTLSSPFESPSGPVGYELNKAEAGGTTPSVTTGSSAGDISVIIGDIVGE